MKAMCLIIKNQIAQGPSVAYASGPVDLPIQHFGTYDWLNAGQNAVVYGGYLGSPLQVRARTSTGQVGTYLR